MVVFVSDSIKRDMPDILTLTQSGLYCPSGDFYIDPWRPVKQAIITHAHSDHARWGSQKYLASTDSVPLLQARLGSDISILGLDYGQRITLGDAIVSLHPAGHVLGSAQIRIEVKGEVWVVTGDFKRMQTDATCQPFEPISCHGLVTESTFGLPVFRWIDDQTLANQIHQWWNNNQQNGRTSILYGYALGKAQRLLSLLNPDQGPIFLHGALGKLTEIYRRAGRQLPPAQLVSEVPRKRDWSSSMILAVPSAHGSRWAKSFGPASTAMASGWMQVRGNRRRRSVDRGFVLSDHADWQGLIETVDQCRPEQVWVTHGYADVLAKYLCEQGYLARSIQTEFVGEVDDVDEVENIFQPHNANQPWKIDQGAP